MDWIDQKYIGLISNRLELFKRVGSTSYNCRCPLCGDSKTNKHKARGYIIEKPTIGTIYYCHNCHESIAFINFLKRIDIQLADQYRHDRVIDRCSAVEQPRIEQKPDISKINRPKFMKGDSPLKRLKKVSQLDHDHYVKQYVQKRQIPSKYHYKLFYAPKFKRWVNTIIPNKFADESNDEPRLIIPFIDRDGNMYGFQGRNFKKDGIRYITIMIDDEMPKVYGLDTVDPRGKVIVVEGPIDSMFLPNSIAMAGSSVDLSRVFPNKDRSEIVVVMDNEPRNKDIVKRIDKYINDGYSVCIWPDDVHQKDINDMILDGVDPEWIIMQNTKSGLAAIAALSQWKRV